MRRLGLVLLSAASLSACASLGPASPPTAQSYADFLIGRVANAREDHRVASDRFYSALRQSPGERYLIEGGVRAALSTGDARRAREVARLANRDMDVPAAQLVLAAEALTAGRHSAARAMLDRTQGAIEEEFAARMLTAWAKAGDGRTDESLTDLQRLSAPRPFSGVFVFQQAMALDLAGRNDEGLAAYVRAEGEGLWLPPGVIRHADLLVRMNRRDEALALMTRFANDTTNPEIADARARLADGRPLTVGAMTAARGAAIGLYGLGALLTQENYADDGLVILSLALMLDPQLESAQLAFAEAQRDQGHNAEARETLASLPQDSVYAESARLISAWILRDEGRQDEAIAAARAASETGGRRAKIALGDLLRSFERYGEAEPIYSELIGEGTDDWRLYFARGASRERLGRWQEAEADLRRALEVSPDQPDVLNYLGYTWVDRGEHLQEGLTMIARAAELRPNSGAILDSLGWAHYQLGNYEEALVHLERAVELEPADAVLNDHLGDGYWRVGRRLEARFQWRRALTLEPNDTLRAALDAKIEAGLPAPAPLANNSAPRAR